MNIQKQTTSEVAYKETVMTYNEEIDPPPPQDISNVFAAADLTSNSSSDSATYKCVWIKGKVIHSSILSAGGCPDAFSRALSISMNHKEMASIMAVTGASFSKKYDNAIT